jgi:hypothetical protein
VFWILVLALSVLAGLGWETEARSADPPRLRLRKLAALGALALLAALFTVILQRAPEAALVVVLAGASLALLAFLPRAGVVAALMVALVSSIWSATGCCDSVPPGPASTRRLPGTRGTSGLNGASTASST